MINEEEEYRKKADELNAKLNDPKIAKKIEGYMKKISDLVMCNVELGFNITPHMDDYMSYNPMETIPEDSQTLTMNKLIESLEKEKGDNQVYIDPIYLNKGVNEIKDLLITTSESKIILVPISNNKQVKL